MRHFSAALLLVLTFSSLAHGQYYGGWGWNGGYHSSTVQEGAARGFADVVRAQGMNNLLNSEAANNMEDARRKYIENRAQATQTYFDMRRMNQQYRESQRRPLSMEQYVRLAREKAPERLSVSQLDPLSGRLTWPLALRDDAYGEDRALIERLFRERASGLDDNFREIDAACDQLLAKLDADLERFKPDDYINAKNFLDSLSYELRLAQR